MELLRIAYAVLNGRHRMFVVDQYCQEYSNWLTGLPNDIFDIWQLSLDYSVEIEALEPARITITVCDIGAATVPPQSRTMTIEQASRLANEPYRIFVENDDADRNFLLTFCNDQQKAKIEELEANNLMRFEHAGGIGELKKKIAKFAAKNPHYPNICAAVFDSDAPQPADFSADAQAVVQFCTENAINAFMLERRAIENYLMLNWLNSWVNMGGRTRRIAHLQRYNEFCKLSKAQRAHYHMKKGLKADISAIGSGKITLYEGVAQSALDALDRGFGDNVGSELYAAPWVQGSSQFEDGEAWDEVNGIVNSFLVLSR